MWWGQQLEESRLEANTNSCVLAFVPSTSCGIISQPLATLEHWCKHNQRSYTWYTCTACAFFYSIEYLLFWIFVYMWVCGGQKCVIGIFVHSLIIVLNSWLLGAYFSDFRCGILLDYGMNWPWWSIKSTGPSESFFMYEPLWPLLFMFFRLWHADKRVLSKLNGL